VVAAGAALAVAVLPHHHLFAEDYIGAVVEEEGMVGEGDRHIGFDIEVVVAEVGIGTAGATEQLSEQPRTGISNKSAKASDSDSFQTLS